MSAPAEPTGAPMRSGRRRTRVEAQLTSERRWHALLPEAKPRHLRMRHRRVLVSRGAASELLDEARGAPAHLGEGAPLDIAGGRRCNVTGAAHLFYDRIVERFVSGERIIPWGARPRRGYQRKLRRAPAEKERRSCRRVGVPERQRRRRRWLNQLRDCCNLRILGLLDRRNHVVQRMKRRLL